MVITSVEIEEILDKLGIAFNDLQSCDIDQLNEAEDTSVLVVPPGGGSGGYAEHVLRYAAKELVLHYYMHVKRSYGILDILRLKWWRFLGDS